MKRFIGFASKFSVLGMVLLLFANCAPEFSEQEQRSVSGLDIGKLYPYYQNKPQFYDDVQIVGKEENSGLWTYQFVASVVYIEQEDQLIDVSLLVLDDQDNIVCPRVTTQVDRTNNHIQIDACTSAINYQNIKVIVEAGVAGQGTTPLRTHSFNLAGI